MSESEGNINSVQDRKAFFRSWLEKLQQESWQLELIISGFALYGVYSAKGILTSIKLWQVNNRVPDFIDFFSTIPETGWKIFFINLLVHVILRALWIGSIGLRYVSNEIEYDNLNYGPFFTDYLRRKVGDYDDFIESLERICSILFSYTFLLFLMAVSFSFVVFFSFIPFFIAEKLSPAAEFTASMFIGFWFLCYWGLGLIVFFDFATGGRLKKVKDKSFSKAYFFLYQFFSIVSLSIFYRPLLYNFLDSKYTRRLFYFSFIYILIINFSDSVFRVSNSRFNPIDHENQTSGLVVNPNYYQDEYEKRLAILGSDERNEFVLQNRFPFRLSSSYLNSSYAHVFLRISDERDDRTLTRKFKVDSRYRSGVLFPWQDAEDLPDVEHAFLDSIDVVLEKGGALRSDVRKEIRELRREKQDARVLSQKLDSLKSLRTRIKESRDNWLEENKKTNHARIKEAHEALFDIAIDAVSINDSLKCVYFNDKINFDRGLLCYFPVSHLTPGQHVLKVSKIDFVDRETGEETRDEYLLPFIRE